MSGCWWFNKKKKKKFLPLLTHERHAIQTVEDDNSVHGGPA
jgi:hypothetical protein